MITAIIRNKENTLVLELPHSIYDIYEKLQSIGIIDTMDGELFVSFWNSGDDYAMMTESEFDEYLQQNEMQMGGM